MPPPPPRGTIITPDESHAHMPPAHRRGSAPRVWQPPTRHAAAVAALLGLILAPIGAALFLLTLPPRLLHWAVRCASESCPPPMHITSKCFPASGHRRSAQDETIVFLHDFRETSAAWTPFAEKLSRQGFTCIVITLPGMSDGRGIGWGERPQEIARQIRSCIAMQGHHGQRVTLICHGLASLYGLAYHAEHPGLVKGMALLDMGGHLPWDDDAFRLAATSRCLYLALAFALGGIAGDLMLWGGLWLTGHACSRRISATRSSMCYPFFYLARDALCGWGVPERSAVDLRAGSFPHAPPAGVPVFFGYTADAEAAGGGGVYFFSNEWLQSLWEAGQSCPVRGYAAGAQGLLVDAHAEMSDDLLQWVRCTVDA